jgi:CRISPR system Cascade subunit CasA
MAAEGVPGTAMTWPERLSRGGKASEVGGRMSDSSFSFNLISEPWIRCEWQGGRREELGLRAVLIEAHEIIEVAGDNPLVTAALHRLLLAIVHRCVGDPAGPRSIGEWQELRRSGRFEPSVIGAYLDPRHDRFHLFHPEQPFYQVAGLPLARAATISRLRQQGDNNPTLFDHQMVDTPPALTPAEAARLLVAVQAFDLGGIKTSDNLQGKESADGAPLVQSAVCLARGANLFETLLLNLHGYDPDDNDLPFSFDSATDRPAWERAGKTESKDRVPDGYLDLLTWQARRVLLVPEQDAGGNVVVRAAVLFKGYQFPTDFYQDSAETMVPYRKVQKPAPGQKPFAPLRLSEDRALWRDSTALMASVDDSAYRRPRTLNWLQRLSSAGADVPNSVPIDVFGFTADKSKPLFWRHERLTLPRAYLENERLVETLQQALNNADTAGRLLGWRLLDVQLLGKARKVPFSSPLMLLAMELAADKDGQKNIAAHISPERGFWQRLEQPFQAFLQALPADNVINSTNDVTYGLTTLPRWRDSVRRAVRAAFQEAISGFDSSGKAQRAVALADQRLGFLLRNLLPEERHTEPFAPPVPLSLNLVTSE